MTKKPTSPFLGSTNLGALSLGKRLKVKKNKQMKNEVWLGKDEREKKTKKEGKEKKKVTIQ
jgi:hypothetical protein